jgi:anti-sigma regulatory factor (Ser/Thr protein kinase)
MTAVTPTQISLAIPGSPEFLRLARLAAADVGTRIGMTYEDLEDLRIAVDELGFTITGGRPETTLSLVFTLTDSTIEVEGTCADEGGSFAPTELARTIVAAVVDEYQLEANDGQRRFRLLKRVPQG